MESERVTQPETTIPRVAQPGTTINSLNPVLSRGSNNLNTVNNALPIVNSLSNPVLGAGSIQNSLYQPGGIFSGVLQNQGAFSNFSGYQQSDFLPSSAGSFRNQSEVQSSAVSENNSFSLIHLSL